MVNMREFSPLNGLEGSRGINFNIAEIRDAKITVRGYMHNKDFVTAVEKVTGATLPTQPWSTEVGKSGITVLWLSPDEWMIRGKAGMQDSIIADLRKEFGDTHACCVDVSDYYLTISLSGKNAVDVLQKGVVVDMHSDAFPIGYATGTRYEKATINLHKTGDDSYEVMIRQSFAEYLWKHFVHGAKEFG